MRCAVVGFNRAFFRWCRAFGGSAGHFGACARLLFVKLGLFENKITFYIRVVRE